MERIYVLAGNYEEFRTYLQHNNLSPKDAVYIDSRLRLLGTENPKVFKVGTWYTRDDRYWIEEEIRLRTRAAESEGRGA
jgi:hypothetical protein